jgi:bifunctional UDP-N-acetylglucosamine pyrophosphorylase/glucosamine-1-phosphate N-acetyltransferase
MKNLRAIILAAGKGTRMKSRVPKVLHKVCGKPLIQYVIDVVKTVGSLEISVVLGHQHQQVSAYLGEGVDIAIQKELLGTADAVRCSAKSMKGFQGDVLILCGDTPLLQASTVGQLIRNHRKANAACTFLTAVVQDNYGYGRILRGPNGKAFAIREENDASPNEKNIAEINVGVYVFQKEILFEAIKNIQMNKAKKEYYLTDVIEIIAEKGLKIETLEAADAKEGMGVNTREDLTVCETIIRERILRDFMLNGVTIVDPNNTYIDADVQIGCDTVIRPFTVIEADVRIGENCSIGPFARIRPGSRIGNQVEVGNFTEISRTQIGERCLMKHFGFLGDADLGQGVNVGAGVVTANYDGVSKNKTHIEDKAFIGSDSILVAPVKIGRKAVTGAGCVVTSGEVVPEGAVVVGVPAREISKNRSSQTGLGVK